MANLSQRDKTHIGFSPRDPFGASSPSSPRRTSDIDFNDVFGGPPRRSSLSELRRSREDSLDLYSSRERGSGSGLGERPVFGEFVGSPARRRHLKDDFFSDIFQSGDSSCSSPRKLERDPFGSSLPGSRILSPVRSVAPVTCESVAGGLSLPAQLSPSMKLAKGMDHPTFSSSTSRGRSSDSYSSPSSPSASVPSLTTRAGQALDDLKIDGHTLYRQSPLSRQVSRCLDNSLEVADSASLSTGSHSQKDPASLEGYVRNGQFHFSIYKWAGKGVTLIMPSHLNSCSKHESRFRRLPEIVLQEADLTLHKDDMPVLKAFKPQSDSEDNESETDLIVKRKEYADLTIVNDLSPAELESNLLQSDKNKNSDTCNKHSEEVPVTLHETHKHGSTNLSQLLDADLDKQYMIRQVEEVEGLFRSQQSVHDDINIKKQAGRENNRNPVSAVSPTMQHVSASPEEKVRGNKVKGKVKDFIKIFNQEGLPKRRGTFETLDKRSREEDGRKHRTIDQVSYSSAKVDKEVKTASRNTSSKLSDSPIPIDLNLEDAEQENSNIIYDVHMVDDFFSERNEPLSQCSDSTPDILGASSYSAEESHSEHLDGCLVEQISLDQNKKTDSLQDQIKTIDAKIRDWSKGKEGNIRSLLSTLQYVLWPRSGWKPVPLVDIIEGSSVKRAYQKALLYLHPDKLQQKGASPDEKYTAEKVFDILQEAWIHFNSISQF